MRAIYLAQVSNFIVTFLQSHYSQTVLFVLNIVIASLFAHYRFYSNKNIPSCFSLCYQSTCFCLFYLHIPITCLIIINYNFNINIETRCFTRSLLRIRLTQSVACGRNPKVPVWIAVAGSNPTAPRRFCVIRATKTNSGCVMTTIVRHPVETSLNLLGPCQIRQQQ